MPPKTRPNNRLLVLCTSINDVTAWPFWKFLQMKKIKGVTDMALLAFNSDGGSFEARIDGDKYSMKNFPKVKGYKQEMFQSFLERWYDPGRSYFVYGGHGMGDYLEFEQHKFCLQAHELAGLLDKKYFEAILFDACFMANLDCAYHLRHNTRYIGACEGYMWEPDTALDYHVFNTFTASAMSRFRDPKLILETIQKEYTSKAPRGDFAVLDTKHVTELRRFLSDHVMQRVYNRATLYNAQQQERLRLCVEHALEASIQQFGQPGGDAYLEELLKHKHRPHTEPATPDAFALANSGRLRRKQRVAAAIQFEHSLYPSEGLDKHLVDVKSYLMDMALEEDAVKEQGATAHRGNGRRRPARKAAAGAWTPSRAYNVDAHGSLPPAPHVSPNEAPPLSSPNRAAAGAAAAGASALGAEESDGIASAYPKDSARYGLDLFNRVVLSHVAPRSEGIYASRLGGLSVTVHEYSASSKPVEPWKVSKTILNKKIKSFLAKGSLEEVHMARDFTAAPSTDAAPADRRAGATVSNAAAASPTETSVTSSAPATATSAAAAASAAAATTAKSSTTPAVMITCHQQSRASAASRDTPSPIPSSPSPLSCPATSTGMALPSAARSAASSQSSSFLAASSAFSSLSSRSRFYASHGCGQHRPLHLSSRGSGSFPSSASSSLSASLTTAEEGGRVLPSTLPRSHSADEVREIQRMAMEAAQLLDPATYF